MAQRFIPGEFITVDDDDVEQTVTVSWHDFTTHAAIDAWAVENGIDTPDDWSGLTLGNKKRWLDENVQPAT